MDSSIKVDVKMEEEKTGFVAMKPAIAIRNNLFSSGLLDYEKSPMSELALNLQLSKVKDARRKLSVKSEEKVPTPEGSMLRAGDNSPLLDCLDLDSPFIEHIRSKKKKDMIRKCGARSMSSPLITRKPLAPLTLFDASMASPVTSPIKTVFNVERLEEKHSDLSICEMADNLPELKDGYEKKKFHFPLSSLSMSNEMDMEIESLHKGESYNDAGFFADAPLQGGDGTSHTPNCPQTFLGLMANPLVQKKVKTEEMDKENHPPARQENSSNKHVFQIPKVIPLLKKRSLSCSIKRESPSTADSPKRTSIKKQKCARSFSFYDGDPALRPLKPLVPIELPTKNPSRALQRSQSFDVQPRKFSTNFDMDDKSLIGDKSKKYILPTCDSKHADLKGINPDTLVDLLKGRYTDEVVEYHIIDCRYPYEFEGGHIKGGVNIHDKQGIIDYFLKSIREVEEGKRMVIIFHCEFSSKRGPALSRFLRNKDRDIHQYEYPKLYYPELYLLEGGYKEFYEQKKDYCEPQGYREMIDVDYNQELRLFSKRSKSWSEGNTGSLRTRTRSLRF